MNCENSSFPINIKKSNKRGTCIKKCNLEVEYHTSKCVATNKGSFLSLSYDKVAIPPVKFNDVSVDVHEVRIYSPSLHTYHSSKEKGEMIILHKGNDMNLAICIPIKLDEDNESFLNEVVEECASFLPNEDETSELKLSDYTLAQFVPMNSPFLHYKCKIPFDCNVQYDAVVFGNKREFISINKESFKMLQSLIFSEKLQVHQNMNYFLNEGGITKNNTSTYIRCYNKKELPKDIAKKYDKMQMDSKEGFQPNSNPSISFEDVIETPESIDIATIGLISILSYGIYWFLREVSTLKK